VELASIRSDAFLSSKTIQIIVATKAGDVYDLYPRLVAEFMPKYIPGNPNIIIQNVAGAAGLIATNRLFAKPDGSHRGHLSGVLYFEQLAKRPEVKFDGASSSDWQHREFEQPHVYARRHALQNDRRHPHRVDAA
jgi:tripartite-type tricarboxylate transporter receptor subunit TctC